MEKRTCKNTNFLIGDMLEGGADLRNLTQRQVTRIARLLNEQPWQTLGMYTPKDKFKALCAESYQVPHVGIWIIPYNIEQPKTYCIECDHE